MQANQWFMSAIFGLWALAACGGSDAEPGGGSAAPDGPTADGPFTPFIVSNLNPDPIPVRGSDGKIHVSYELMVINSAPRDATVTRIETLAEGRKSKNKILHSKSPERVVATVERDEVVARSVLIGDYKLPPVPAATLPAGGTMIFVIDDIYDDRSAVPANFKNRLHATFGPILPNQADFANNFPEQVTQDGIAIVASKDKPIRIGAPLLGADWVAFNACCELSAHRGALVPLEGRINAAERYAVDWFRSDLTIKPLYDEEGGLGTFRGDRTRNESFLAFDQPVLAVADGTVITAVSNVPDATPLAIPPGLKIDELGGNHVVLKIDSGHYAFYAHLKQGSVTLRPGGAVWKGQEIGRLGNTGSSSEPHLHFHLMAGPQPLTSRNLPFVIESFYFQGIAKVAGFEPAPDAGDRENQLPLIRSVIGFR